MSDVTVIGMGAMGSAIAGALLEAGCDVTVWNRNAARCAALVARGATGARTPEAAIRSSPATIFSIDDYAATREVLRQPGVASAVANRMLVQFSTGTPQDARDAEQWARANGANYLDGAILAYPREIGASALVFVSGNALDFEQHRPVLANLTDDLRYLGAAIGSAAALDLAVLSYYIGSHLGLVHGALICESEHVEADVLSSVIVDSLPSDVTEVAHLGEALARNDFSSPGASLAVYSGILDRLLTQARDGGVNAEFAEFADNLVKRGMAAGLGDEEIVSIIKVLRRKH
ncbi:MAG TPA: NAD(P)-binding domain-containing protein [Woeseiaceae bacterium]